MSLVPFNPSSGLVLTSDVYGRLKESFVSYANFPGIFSFYRNPTTTGTDLALSYGLQEGGIIRPVRDSGGEYVCDELHSGEVLHSFRV